LKVQKYDPRQLDEFAQQLSQLSEDALVVGHSNTTPYLVNTLTGQNITLSEDDYGDIFWVRFDEQGQVVTFKTGRVNRSR
jgi:phosphohistidine phosphatase SixA